MAQISCKFCLKAVEANQWAVHITEKQHQENLPSKLLVQGSFESGRIGEIHEYFAQFGKIAKGEVVVRNDIFVNLLQYTYEDPISYSTVAHREHILWGRKLAVSWCKNSCSEEIEKIETVPFAVIKPMFNSLLSQPHTTFCEQVATLRKFFQANTSKIEIAKKAIRDDLSAILSLIPWFDSSKIQFFGSTVMDLAILGSNVDVNIQDVPEDAVLDLVTRSENFVYVQLVVNEFRVIRCRHVPTNMVCHLQIGNKLAVRNSELIKYYVGLDEKIHSLMLVVKIWRKYHNLITGNSSYSFYLLVIFFLQQDQYKIPTVVDLQHLTVPEDESEWNCAFTAIPLSCPGLQSSTIRDLVFGFFEFYEQYDYITFIVAPYCGKRVQKISLLKPYYLPKHYQQYLQFKCSLNFHCGICIQDPFEHSKIIPWKPSLKSSGNFTRCCRQSYNLSVEESQLLHELLNWNYAERIFTMRRIEGLTSKQWYDAVKRATTFTLAHILKYKITKRDPEDVDTYHCSAHIDVWTGRIKTLKTQMQHPSRYLNRDEIKKEKLVSNTLSKLAGNVFRPDQVSVHITFHEDEDMARFSITGNNDVGTHLDHFLRVKLEVFLNANAGFVPAVAWKKDPEVIFTQFKESNDALLRQQGDVDFFQQIACVIVNFPCKNPLPEGKEAILRDVYAALQHVPRHKIRLFGSFSTGLQLPTSPIDVHVDCQPANAELLSGFTQTKKFKDASISGQEVRMLMCRHATTHISCRVTISSKARMQTDELIRYYLSLNEKVWQLMLILKYWLRCHRKNFSSCMLYMLVIFYLQQEPYKIPAVVDLQVNVVPMMHRGWNYAFAPVRFSSASLQSATMLELVEGFLKFYESFDHISYIVSPYTGCAIAKVDFVQPYNLPQFYQLFMSKNSVLNVTADMYVQHPFNHVENLVMYSGRNVFWGALFASLCREVLPLMRQESQLYNICANRESAFTKNAIGYATFATFSLEKPEGYSGVEFTDSLKELFQYTLTNILGCSNKNAYKYCHIWNNRERVLKGLLQSLPIDATELQKEVAIARSTGQQTDDNLLLDFKFIRDPLRAVFTITGPKKQLLAQLVHYLRVKLPKFLQEMKSTQVTNIEEQTKGFHEPEPIHPEAVLVEELITPVVEHEPESEVKPLVKTEKSHSEDEKEEVIGDEEEEEDVPDNFFDDFANEDFLDGLDLVECTEEDRKSTKSCDRISPIERMSLEEESCSSKASDKRFRSSSHDERISIPRSSSSLKKSRSPARKSRRDYKRSRSKRTRRSRSRRRSLTGSTTRDRSRRRYRNKRKWSRDSSTRSSSRSRRRRFFSSAERIMEEARKQTVFQEIQDQINGVIPVSAPVVPRQNLTLVPVASLGPVHPISLQQNEKSFSDATAPKPMFSASVSVSKDDSVHKMFAQKKLPLPDYLTILSQQQVHTLLTPEQLQRKVKVICRCQQFLQAGTPVPFRVRPSSQLKPKLHPSPMHKSMAKLKFTSPAKDEAETFSNALYISLDRIGLFRDVFNSEKLVDSVAEALSSGAGIDSSLATQILQVSLLGPKGPRHCAPPKRSIDVGTQTRLSGRGVDNSSEIPDRGRKSRDCYEGRGASRFDKTFI